MPLDDQVSRYEMNRNVRMVLTRHDADLTRIDYSCMGGTVYLYGDLVRPDKDFSAKEIEFIVGEIATLPHVRDTQFDLNNWVVVAAGNSWQITTKTKKSAPTRAAALSGSSDDSTVVIDKAEKLTDVLDDLGSDSKKEEDGGPTNPQ